MKKFLSVILAVAIGTTMFVGCVANEPEEPATTESTEPSSSETAEKPKYDTLKVGTMTSAMGAPVQYAIDQGYYIDEGLDVELIMFPTGAPINEALAAEEIDIAASGLASVFSLAIGNCEWIGETNTAGGMGLYVRADSPIAQVKGTVPDHPDIMGNAETVKGAKILAPLGTSAQFLTVRYLEQIGLTEADVEQVHMEYGTSYQAFIAGEGDIISATPPFSYQLEDAGYIQIAEFEDTTEVMLMDGLIARKEVVAERPEELTAFLRATYKAYEEFHNDPALRKEFSMKWFSENGKVYTEDVMDREMVDRQYLTKEDMQNPEYIFGTGMIEIAAFFAENGKIEPDNLPNVPASFNTTFLEEALGIEVKVAQ